ncbi:seipin co-factor family protein [Aspergillus clavatus NRRL 1]|uniref:Uncharacterized protein n=1 Tax=Aspergillus clavatus (strain ATCC 1007 / CBS 513.65 / DSM 816 / NCTC 3887 / NRRL 1 / QM 1276 / 107) TaxID=344612 RepID=A1CAP8_ASPCL|nr:uncharacterized protein ACLA_012440 [Aspergillus clavatus NRRL 1]EAW12816.1 conserved hypothetical protein [Aspergillus clavatus NRRL 1]
MSDPIDLLSRPDSQNKHGENHSSAEQQPNSNESHDEKQPEHHHQPSSHPALVSTPYTKPPKPSPTDDDDDDYNHAEDANPIVSTALSLLSLLNTYVLPSHLRAMIMDVATAHPLLMTFLLCQFVCSCIPIAMFVVGAMVAAGIAVVLFSCVALLVLGPVLIATTVAGMLLWGSGWAIFVTGRWFVRYLDEMGDEQRGRNLAGVNGVKGHNGGMPVKEVLD